MKTTCYLQVEPEFGRYHDNRDKVQSITVQRVTQKRPTSPLPGAVVVKISIDIADAAFEPLRPEVEVVIPAEHTEAIRAESEPVQILGGETN